MPFEAKRTDDEKINLCEELHRLIELYTPDLGYLAGRAKAGKIIYDREGIHRGTLNQWYRQWTNGKLVRPDKQPENNHMIAFLPNQPKNHRLQR